MGPRNPGWPSFTSPPPRRPRSEWSADEEELRVELAAAYRVAAFILISSCTDLPATSERSDGLALGQLTTMRVESSFAELGSTQVLGASPPTCTQQHFGTQQPSPLAPRDI